MKKIIVCLLAAVMTISFAACSSETKTYDESTEDKIELEDSAELDSGVDSIEETSTDSTGFSFEMPEMETPVLDDLVSDVVTTVFSFENPEFNFELEDFEFDMKYNTDIDIDLGSISDDKKIEINTTKSSLLTNLALAFKEEGLNVSINTKSGEVSLDSSVLFGGDSAELSDEGRAFLKKFINAYSSVVYKPEYDGFISKIMVEGHTAPVSGSTYENGLPLSEKRAEVVKEYCLSVDTGISAETNEKLASDLEAKGVSNSKPIKDESGNIDTAASRRVTFRFLINMDSVTE